MNDNTFRAWLNGQNDNINFTTISQLARVLGISLDWVAADELPDDAIPEWAWHRADLVIQRVRRYEPESHLIEREEAPEPRVEARIIAVQDRTEHYERIMRGEVKPSPPPPPPAPPAGRPPRKGRTGPSTSSGGRKKT